MVTTIFKVIPQYCIVQPLLRTIFASLVLTNEHMHIHNDRNFPQAKLESEINVPFHLNKHGDLCFLLHNNSVHIILFN